MDPTQSTKPTGSEHFALGMLCLGVVGIAWAPILFRLSEVGPIATAFWRVALAFPVLLVWRLVEVRRRAVAADAPTAGGTGSWMSGRVGLFAAGAFFAGDLAFWHWSLTWTSVANATLFANAAPIFVTLAAWMLFRRRFSARFLLGLGLAITGAAILMGSSLRIGPDHLVGDLLGMITAMFLAGYLLTVERLRAAHSTASIMVWNAGAGAVLLLPLALVMEPVLLPPATIDGWWPMLVLALVSHVAGQSLIAYSMVRLPAALTAVSLLLQPVLAGLFAWAVLGEPVGVLQLVGGAVILAGVLLAREGSRR